MVNLTIAEFLGVIVFCWAKIEEASSREDYDRMVLVENFIMG